MKEKPDDEISKLNDKVKKLEEQIKGLINQRGIVNGNKIF